AGANLQTAYAIQGAAAFAALAVVAAAWASPTSPQLKAAIAIIATLLTTPYCLDYDMVVLAPAAAFLVGAGASRQPPPYEKTVLAVSFAAPLLARPVASLIPIAPGVIAVALAFALAARRIEREGAASRQKAAAPR
ncbi:MAG: DUF2029 domain-containing protein, partial [Methylocystis sp.]|nr:DUF2029 domain-containing protein [Methylocystis sp.]